MAKDKSLSKEERKAAKKTAKETLVESGAIKKEKKDKKDKKEKKAKLVEVLTSQTNGNVAASGEVVSEDEDMTLEKPTRPIGALVPFANPLADDKVAKKVFRGVKKAAAQRTLKRGVKEVVKALRKSVAGGDGPVGIVVLAADISPMDVISHIPVLCEDHNIPYVYVTSRAELGMAGQTKRPTSVVMISRDLGKQKAGESVDPTEWTETYKGLLKTVQKEGQHVKI